MCCLFHLFVLKPPSQWLFNIPKVYSIFKNNTAVTTLPITLLTPHLSSPFQSQTHFHVHLSLLWCHFPPSRWVCSHQSPQWLLCDQWAFVILALSPLCNSGYCWPCFPSGNACLLLFSACNHTLSVSCATCFSILFLNVDILQVTVLEFFVFSRLCLGKPQPLTWLQWPSELLPYVSLFLAWSDFMWHFHPAITKMPQSENVRNNSSFPIPAFGTTC